MNTSTFARPALRAGLLAAMLSACATLGPPYQPVVSVPPDKALVYIYRPTSFVGGGISYTVHAGEQPVVKLLSGGYRAYVSEPGEVEFWARTESRSSVTQILRPGETYYLKGTVGVGVIAGRPKLVFVDAATARAEITGTKLIP